MNIKSLVITAVLATAILCFACLPVGMAGFVSAQTVDNSALIAQLQAQMASLMAQIQVLQAQQGTTTAWCHTFNTNLGVGSTGDDVYALNKALNSELIQSVDLTVSSTAGRTFDESTAVSVVQFQQKYSITPLSGYVGVKTRAKLNSLYGCGITPTPTPQCSNLYWIDKTNNSCQSQKQFCGAYMYYGLHTYSNQHDCLEAAAIQTTCIPNWQCGWGPCMNGGQSQVAVDSNNCGVTTGNNIACPKNLRLCTPSTQPSITVTSPNGGETWKVGETHNIIWTSVGLNSSDLLEVALLNGSNPAFTIAGNVPNTGSYSWQIGSNVASGNYKREVVDDDYPVKGAGPIGYSGSFSIVASATTQQPSITVTSPNGGESFTIGTSIPVSFTSNLSAGTPFEVYLGAINGGGFSSQNGVISGTNPQTVSFAANGAVPGNTYKINVNATVNGVVVQDTSDNYFSIVAPTTSSLSVSNVTCSVTVTGSNNNDVFTFAGSPTGGTLPYSYMLKNVIYGGAATSYVATVPGTLGSDMYHNLGVSGAYLSVTSQDGQSATVQCQQVCTPNWQCGSWSTCANSSQTRTCTDGNNCGVTAGKPTTTQSCTTSIQPSITVTSPNGGEQWAQGSTHNITWNSSGINNINISAVAGGSNLVIANGVSASHGSYAWTVPSTFMPGNYVLTLSSLDGSYLISSNTFSIVAPTTTPSITVTSPNGGESWTSGTAHNITWSSQNLGSFNVSVSLIYYNNAGQQASTINIASNLPNTGSYSWTIPPDFKWAGAGSNFKVLVSSFDKGLSAQDYSDSYFSIVAPTLSVSNVTCSVTVTGATNNDVFTFAGSPTGGTLPYSYMLKNVIYGGAATSFVATVPGTLGSDMYHNLGVSGAYLAVTSKDGQSANVQCTPPTTGLNVSQDSLASISDAIAKIVAEIQAMLNK